MAALEGLGVGLEVGVDAGIEVVDIGTEMIEGGLEAAEIPRTRVDEGRLDDALELERGEHVGLVGIEDRVGQGKEFGSGDGGLERIAGGDETPLVEVRQARHGRVADGRQDLEVIAVQQGGNLLRDVDAVDIVGDEFGHVAAHPAVFHNGDDARDEQDHRDGTETQQQFGPERKVHLADAVSQFPEHNV